MHGAAEVTFTIMYSSFYFTARGCRRGEIHSGCMHRVFFAASRFHYHADTAPQPPWGAHALTSPESRGAAVAAARTDGAGFSCDVDRCHTP